MVVLVGTLLGPVCADTDRVRAALPKKKPSPVWIVFFTSPECEKCQAVKQLMERLKRSYPVRVKTFSIDRATDRVTFRSLEAIHASRGFAVPLVLVGETILMGEDRISEQLEQVVRKLAQSGGAPLPYLGSGSAKKSAPESTVPCYECEQRGRPPEVTDELRRIRKFIDRFR
jgi:thiol-disulfide isomerase/thioredoxin